MTVLVDTSVWIDYLRYGDEVLKRLLANDAVLSHPFVVGELAMVGLNPRAEILGFLHELPASVVAMEAEVLRFVDEYHLYGLGVGYVDVHLLVAARLTPETQFWTRDERLLEIAVRLRLAFDAAAESRPVQ